MVYLLNADFNIFKNDSAILNIYWDYSFKNVGIYIPL